MKGLKIEGNVSALGNKKSYFYQIQSTDVEHLYTSGLQGLFSGVINSLNRLSIHSASDIKAKPTNTSGYFYKILRKDEKIFLSTTDENVEIAGYELLAEKNPISHVLGKEDINSKVIFEKDHLIVNGRYMRFINLYSMPPSLSFNAFANIGNYLLTFRKYPLDQAKAVANKSRKVHSANSLATKALRNIESERSLDDSENIYNLLIDGSENLFDVQAWFIVEASTKQELDQKSDEVVASIKRIDADPLIETVATLTVFKNMIPAPFCDFKRSHLCNSTYLSCFLPFVTEKVHKGGVSFLSSSYNELSIDLFNPELMNFNAVFTGKSGTGKSALAQKFVFELLNDGVSAVIIDKGYSFKKITTYMGGNILSEKINPMQFKNATYLKEFLLAGVPDGEITFKTKGKIFQLVSDFLINTPQGTFRELIEFISKDVVDFDCYFAEFWNYITDDEIQIHPITYIDTNLYPDSLIASLIIYLIEYFGNIKGKKILLCDECWDQLNRNAEYIEEKSRTLRKENGSLITITQSVGDYLSGDSRVGRVVYNMASHKFHFREDSIVENLINAEDAEEIKLLKSVNGEYSEFLYKDDNLKKIVRYQMTELEYELFSTKKDHVLKFEKFAERYEDFFSFREIVHKWVDFKYYHKEIQ